MSVIKAGTTVTTALVLEGNTDGDLIFKTGSAAVTAMSISASGVVTFPATTGFDIASANITNLTATTLTVSGLGAFPLGASATPSIIFSGDPNTGIYSPTADNFAISTGGAERLRIDSSGIFGLGATPSAWGSNSAYKAIQLGGSSYSFFAGNQTTYVYGNAYWNGTDNKYINNGTACSFGVNVGGNYQFNVAASGTAGNNISFTEAVTISSSGNVGINKTNPTYLLEMEGSAPRATIRGTTNGSNVGYRLDTKDSGGTQRYGGYYYQPQTGTNESYLGLSADDSGYQLGVKANGNVFLLGGATNATGTGITFPATQNASSNANCLDDYEQGTWSPSVGGTSTYTIQKGQYTKIGDLVVAAFDMQIDTIGTGSTTVLGGLPFTSAPSGAPQGIVAPASYWATLAVSVYWLAFRIDESTTNMNNQYTTAAATTALVNGAIFQSGTRVIGTLTYYAS